jgi:tetratricopeptide (TPR) repeat protein
MAGSRQSRFKRKLEGKLIYSPFLRLVLFNSWFRVAFLLIVLVAVFAALYIPKIWRTSPDDFLPIIRVSGLDMTQNWSLKRSARNYMQRGDFAGAASSWEAAVAQNPGDGSAFRGYLENALKLSTADKRVYNVAVSQMVWLLRLGKTNESDVILCGEVCGKFKWHDVLLHLFRPIADKLPSAAEGQYLKALFQQNRMAEFEGYLTAREKKLSDPELPIYKLAFEAGWRPNGDGSAFERLEQESEKVEHAVLATQLLMRVAAQKNKVSSYGKCLERLSALNESSVTDHTFYWSLLAANGRKEEAIPLAQSFTRAPTSSLETVHLADAYFRLGLIDPCREVLKRFAPEFAHSPEVWSAYAAVLEKLNEWDEMRLMAAQIRVPQSNRDTLWGFSYYLEGRADLAQERRVSAELAFEKAAQCAYHIPELGLEIAKEMLRLKYPKPAVKVLASIEGRAAQRADYWELVFDAAFAEQDASAVLNAAEKAYLLDSRDPQKRHRYAAALMLNRTKPDEAVKLTLELFSNYPKSAPTVINHSLALLLNQRTAEAREILERIHPTALKPLEQSAYYLALFEVYHNLKLWDAAWKASDKIAVGTLFPIQREWLQEKCRQMPQRLAGI